MLYVIFYDPDGYFVAKITDRAKCVSGPFRTREYAASRAEHLATQAALSSGKAVFGAWPAEFATSEREYAAELGVDILPREAWIVR